ncbi:MAG: arginine deiminase family protein [Pirellulales bacterium]|nr:arginine deiminase family protein [Pirellulales bacterium]
MIVLVHVPSAKLQLGERMFVDRAVLDFDRAAQQHEAYCRVLTDCGANVVSLDVNADLPDSVFIEDTTVVVDRIAILMSMGAFSRQDEPAGLTATLKQYRDVEEINLPARIEGGDVLRVGRRLFVGLSQRTDKAGVEALAEIATRFGYQITPVPVRGCLHLKTACTALPDGRLLVNPNWLDVNALGRWDLIEIPADEPWGANVLPVHETVILPAAHVNTANLVDSLGFAVQLVEISEFAKAEGGVTCLSLLIERE